MTHNQRITAGKFSYSKLIAGLLIGLVLGLLILQYIQLIEVGEFFWQGDLTPYIRKRSLIFLCICAAACMLLLFYHKKILSLLFKYRWLIACCVFIFCVAFEISGSSIGLLIDLVGDDDSFLLGKSRSVRSDEWMVFTPMAISQCTTDGGVFSYFQDSFRGIETDMYCIYGQPVWDIAILFRPFEIGYLFLGASRGLAFFWCGRAIMLFMICFEFAYRIITSNSKSISAAYAFLITFSASVQWWFSINGLVELLIFGQLALIWVNCYLHTESYKSRASYAIGIGWCLVVYILVFYPAWQISFAYVFLGIFIALIVKEAHKAKWTQIDIGMAAISIGIIVLAVAYVFLFKSWDTIQTEMNTAYPGARSDTGGGALSMLFSYPISLILPIYDGSILPNSSEAASFFTLFPLSLILPIYIMLKNRKLLPMLLCLLVVSIFLVWYITFGLPDIVAKISLLDKSTSKRAVIAIQYALVILLFCSLPYLKEFNGKEKTILFFITAASIVLGCYFQNQNYSALSFAAIVLVSIACAGAFTFFNGSYKTTNVLLASTVTVSLLCGILVNPIRGSIEPYFNNDIANQINTLSTNEDKWAVVGSSLPLNNYISSLGWKTLNSTNVYPQIETWKILDPDGAYDEIYNRYAHILINLKDEGSAEFDLIQGDLFSVTLTVEDLRKIGVTKFMSCNYQIDSGQISEIGTGGEASFYSIVAD